MDENLCRLYEALLKKYRELINENERKTVGEIKGLVNKEDLTVLSFIDQFKPKEYNFERDYLDVLKKCYEFVVKEISYAKLDFELNYWFDASEILKYKVGDDEDIAIFLCSVMFALGDNNAAVVVFELEDYSTHAVVITEFGGKFILLDATQKVEFERFIGRKEEVLEKYRFKGKRIKRPVYKFNHFHYEQFV